MKENSVAVRASFSPRLIMTCALRGARTRLLDTLPSLRFSDAFGKSVQNAEV